MKPAWPHFNSAMVQAARTACAVSAIAMLPVLSWQAMDGRGSDARAAIAPAGKAIAETIVSKSGPTWSHKKADRLSIGREVITAIIETDDQALAVDDTTVDADGTALDGLDAVSGVLSADPTQQEEFSDWLVSSNVDAPSARIMDFASRKTNANRDSCKASHDKLVSAFALDKVRVLSDQPMLFQSSICADNGEIVVTCFGTTSTISPRQSRPASHCAKRS